MPFLKTLLFDRLTQDRQTTTSQTCLQDCCSSELSLKVSVVDPEMFIPDPDPAFNVPSSGSGSRPRQQFRIHADPDPTHII